MPFTGAGKSLCFQLPALVLSEKYKALTIVVTPLVALMEDHMRRLPLGLRGAALHGNLPVRRQPWREMHTLSTSIDPPLAQVGVSSCRRKRRR